MNVNFLRPSSDSSSDSGTPSSSGESSDEFHRNILQAGEILGYQFELRRDTKSVSGESAGNEQSEQSTSIDEEESSVRLGNLDW